MYWEEECEQLINYLTAKYWELRIFFSLMWILLTSWSGTDHVVDLRWHKGSPTLIDSVQNIDVCLNGNRKIIKSRAPFHLPPFCKYFHDCCYMECSSGMPQRDKLVWRTYESVKFRMSRTARYPHIYVPRISRLWNSLTKRSRNVKIK